MFWLEVVLILPEAEQLPELSLSPLLAFIKMSWDRSKDLSLSLEFKLMKIGFLAKGC
jgi:hypothetical protein